MFRERLREMQAQAGRRASDEAELHLPRHNSARIPVPGNGVAADNREFRTTKKAFTLAKLM